MGRVCAVWGNILYSRALFLPAKGKITMIRGKFLTSMDDITPVLRVREAVFGPGPAGQRDAGDGMAVYALAFDEAGNPAGSGRLTIEGDRFTLSRLGVLKEARGKGLGDLIARMLLFRAQELNAAAVYVSARLDAVDFYRRYGLTPMGEVYQENGVPCRLMRAGAEQINLEGACSKGSKNCANCSGNCEACP